MFTQIFVWFCSCIENNICKLVCIRISYPDLITVIIIQSDIEVRVYQSACASATMWKVFVNKRTEVTDLIQSIEQKKCPNNKLHLSIRELQNYVTFAFVSFAWSKKKKKKVSISKNLWFMLFNL